MHTNTKIKISSTPCVNYITHQALLACCKFCENEVPVNTSIFYCASNDILYAHYIGYIISVYLLLCKIKMIAKVDHSGEKKESWHCKRMISLGNSLSRSTLLISVKKRFLLNVVYI